MKRASGSTCSRSPGMQKKRQSSSKPAGGALDLGGDLGQAAERQEVGEGAVGAVSTASSQHLAAQRREHDRDRRAPGGDSSLKPVLGALAGQARCRRKSSVSRTLLSGFSKGIPFQPSTMRSEEEPMPSTKRPREASASAAASCASSAGPRWKTPTIPVPEPHLLGPGGAQGQRREAVGPGGLAAPEVGVARAPRPASRAPRGRPARRPAAAASIPNAEPSPDPIACGADGRDVRRQSRTATSRWSWCGSPRRPPSRPPAGSGAATSSPPTAPPSTRCASCSTRSRWTASS